MYQHLKDEELLSLLRNNDKRAFAEIYDRYWEQMSLYVLKVTRSPEDACDIVQDVFVSIWKRRAELMIHGALKAYLLKSVRNLSIRYIEKNISKKGFVASLSLYWNSSDTSTTHALEFRELESKLTRVIAKLPPKMQQVFVLSRHENLSYKEIAQRLGIAETTVKKQVNNALKMIRTEVSGTHTITVFIPALFLQALANSILTHIS
ncbi:RNA polymerase sigma-70 factor [Agriterribacter sp.]|uniref:RNA polymerase sigma factor n=1 Tax=Agriterribacter sp. TaxID=2821509 RepID=UPI002CCB3D0A|nr:RNA polymerase sigma-70 factor [Agriterribacter sp.]HTN05893.1 RNA polymerase sigma-70 factor [Agriterribacter sp.]